MRRALVRWGSQRAVARCFALLDRAALLPTPGVERQHASLLRRAENEGRSKDELKHYKYGIGRYTEAKMNKTLSLYQTWGIVSLPNLRTFWSTALRVIVFRYTLRALFDYLLVHRTLKSSSLGVIGKKAMAFKQSTREVGVNYMCFSEHFLCCGWWRNHAWFRIASFQRRRVVGALPVVPSANTYHHYIDALSRMQSSIKHITKYPHKQSDAQAKDTVTKKNRQNTSSLWLDK